MNQDENVRITNRYLNLTYIMAGCLQNSCNNMNEFMVKVGHDLRHDNKHLLKLVISTSKRLQSLIEQLAKISILTCDDETIYVHEDAVCKYYALMMRLVSIIGSDKYSELRSYYLYKHLTDTFEQNLDFKNGTLENIAFYGTKQRIADGTYTDDELHSCLKVK